MNGGVSSLEFKEQMQCMCVWRFLEKGKKTVELTEKGFDFVEREKEK